MVNVLVIEDDANMQTIIRWIIEEFSASSGIVAYPEFITDGRKAWRNLRERPFDLILLDLSLPLMTGFEILELVRPGIYTPIIVLSSSSENSDVAKAYLLGANAYIHKSGVKKLKTSLKATLSYFLEHSLLPCPLY